MDTHQNVFFFRIFALCSFALAKMTPLSINIQGEKTLSSLKSEGLLRIEMRFAKGYVYMFMCLYKIFKNVTVPSRFINTKHEIKLITFF